MIITFEDGSTRSVKPGPLYMKTADRHAFEREFGESLMRIIKEDRIGERHVGFLTWREMYRTQRSQGLPVPAFEAWEETLVDISMDPDEQEKAKALGMAPEPDKGADVPDPTRSKPSSSQRLRATTASPSGKRPTTSKKR